MRVLDVMSSPVTTVRATELVKDVAASIAAHGYTCFPVVAEGDGLIGIVTEADLVDGQFLHDPRSAGVLQADLDRPAPPTTISEVMSIDVRAVSPTTDMADVAQIMVDDKRRCLPVVDGGKLVGIITRRDLVRVVGRDDDSVAREVRGQLSSAFRGRRWTVRVNHGVVRIDDTMDSASDRHVAVVLAAAVPGVLHVDAAYCPA